MRFIFALLFAVSLVSCNDSASNGYKFEGDAIGFENGDKIYVFTLENKQPKAVDTLTVTDGKFSATYNKSEGYNLNFLRIDGVNGSVLYFPENVDMKAVVYKDSLQASRVSGGKENEAYSKFVDKMVSLNKVKQQQD